MNPKVRKNIIKSNLSIWDQKKFKNIALKGLYEVYFLTLYNRTRKEAYWIRYTLVCKKSSRIGSNDLNNTDLGQGLLWFGYFNSIDRTKNFITKKSFPLSAIHGSEKRGDQYYFITIDNSFLALDQAKGVLNIKSGKSYGWDLKLSNFQNPNDIVPAIAKKLKITNTMNKATHPHCTISGTITINEEMIIIEKADAIQYHTYADKYSVPWEWFSCYTIKEWPLGYIDFSYKKDKGILEIFDGEKSYTPWNKTVFSKLLKSKKLTRKKTFTSIMFNLQADKNVTLSGFVIVDKDQLLGVEYKGPTGEKHYCYNSEIATGEFKIIKNLKKDQKQNKIRLKVDTSIAFETTYDKPIDGIRYLAWEDEEL